MKSTFVFLYSAVVFFACTNSSKNYMDKSHYQLMAEDVKNETKRAWEAYTNYAWGHDELLPLSKSHHDWYDEPLYISLIDAYSTLKIMGFEENAQRIEQFIIDSVSFDKDVFVKTFEVNIRILGGLLSMYDMNKNPEILKKAEDFAGRILPAFHSASGMPYYDVNLKSGEVMGDVICAAEAGSYLLEMGVLSFYTRNPEYYQAAKEATKALFNTRSRLGLIGQNYNVETGQSLDSISQVGCFVDSYYEYLYKGWRLFGDPELKAMWDSSIAAIQFHIALESDTSLWYPIVNSVSGKLEETHVRLWDAYFPALLIYSGDTIRGKKSLLTWDKLWNKHGLIPMGYNFGDDEITIAGYDLNPELIESTYYHWYLTRDTAYLEMLEKYYSDIKQYCRTEIAYTYIKNVVTKEQDDQLATFFFAETMKYFYLAFNLDSEVNLDNNVFSTEAHPYKISHFELEKVNKYLGIKSE